MKVCSRSQINFLLGVWVDEFHARARFEFEKHFPFLSRLMSAARSAFIHTRLVLENHPTRLVPENHSPTRLLLENHPIRLVLETISFTYWC